MDTLPEERAREILAAALDEYDSEHGVCSSVLHWSSAARQLLAAKPSLVEPVESTGNVVLAIGEDAFKAGWDACEKLWHAFVKHEDYRERAWSNYTPPEHIKVLI